jgi:flagellar FliL protein
MKKSFIFQHFFYGFIFLSLIFSVPVLAADDEDGAVTEEAIYYELAPPFVVNLQDSGKRIRFLQVRIQVLAYGQDKIDKVKMHDPVIRDALITLLAGQSRKDINTSQKKKALQEKALKLVKNVLKDETGRTQIEGLYFTNFVVQ